MCISNYISGDYTYKILCVYMCILDFIYMCIYISAYIIYGIYKEFCFKELAPVIRGTGKSEIFRAGWQIWNLDKNWHCSLETEFLLFWKTSDFALKIFNWLDEVPPTLPRVILLKINSLQMLTTILTKITRFYNLAELIFKSNHHRDTCPGKECQTRGV